LSVSFHVTKIAIILNPSAHSERAQSLSEQVARLAPEAALKFTTGPGMARHLAAQAVQEGFDIVVAAGGDGTVNEVAQGLFGSRVALGVLPFGTMNVFSKEHHLPEELAGAWRVIRAGATREIDIGAANQHYFVQLAGVGFDAQVVKETTWESKRRYGPLSYVMSGATVAGRTPPALTVEAAGIQHTGAAVLVGNGRYYGAKLAVFPEARPDDGLLDVLVFKHVSYIDLARYFGGILVGNHTELPDVSYFQARELTVRSEESVPVEVDGELIGDLPVTFRIAGRMRLCVPAEYADAAQG